MPIIMGKLATHGKSTTSSRECYNFECSLYSKMCKDNWWINYMALVLVCRKAREIIYFPSEWLVYTIPGHAPIRINSYNSINLNITSVLHLAPLIWGMKIYSYKFSEIYAVN